MQYITNFNVTILKVSLQYTLSCNYFQMFSHRNDEFDDFDDFDDFDFGVEVKQQSQHEMYYDENLCKYVDYSFSHYDDDRNPYSYNDEFDTNDAPDEDVIVECERQDGENEQP